MHTCIDPFSFPIQIPLLCVQAYILLLLDIVGRQTLLQLPYAVTVYYVIMLLTVKTIADNIMIIIMSGI